ncbi:hypothetical protein JTE90_011427 [Oedothorax gibbosus]|uniref:THAP-type domain-containing protein n=1 Tax=Oedothorax gibbosus TaxID=931172 RepID=A0AAV6VBK8_9ARAC|nr:hypothetical protein JTE90_011427 [Oedothorax gibbosus]
MVARCEVCGITKRTNSISYNALKNISFHRFPLHRPEVLEKWLLFVGRSNFSPKNYNRVCSVHFTDNSFQFRPKAENRLLKEDAVPTLYPFGTKQPIIPSSSSSSQPIKQEPSDTHFEPHIANMVIVSDRNDYKNVLNSYTDANRRIVVSDTSSLKDGSGSALAKICQASPSLSASIATFELIDVNAYKKDPLANCEDEFHTFRIKELEKVFKPLRREKRRWQLKIRRSKVKFKKLRKEYFQYLSQDEPLMRCNSQPVVHFLSLEVQNP